MCVAVRDRPVVCLEPLVKGLVRARGFYALVWVQWSISQHNMSYQTLCKCLGQAACGYSAGV